MNQGAQCIQIRFDCMWNVYIAATSAKARNRQAPGAQDISQTFRFAFHPDGFSSLHIQTSGSKWLRSIECTAFGIDAVKGRCTNGIAFCDVGASYVTDYHADAVWRQNHNKFTYMNWVALLSLHCQGFANEIEWTIARARNHESGSEEKRMQKKSIDSSDRRCEKHVRQRKSIIAYRTHKTAAPHSPIHVGQLIIFVHGMKWK